MKELRQLSAVLRDKTMREKLTLDTHDGRLVLCTYVARQCYWPEVELPDWLRGLLRTAWQRGYGQAIQEGKDALRALESVRKEPE